MINLSVVRNFYGAQKFQKGTIISENGTEKMYIILRGDVSVFSNFNSRYVELIAKYGPGDFFGESVLFSGEPLPHTVLAMSEVIVMPVDRENAVEFFRDEAELAFEIMKELSLRLMKMSEAGKPEKARTTDKPKPLPETEADPIKTQSQEQKPAAGKTETPGQKSEPKAFPLLQRVKTVPEEQENTEQRGLVSLFPDGHKSYELKLNLEKHEYFMEKSFTCPICKNSFRTIRVRPSKLSLVSKDGDMRNRYKGVEPIYFEVLTCPHCLYSALGDMFTSPEKPKIEELCELESIKPGVKIKVGTDFNTYTVFAGYYLALFCAPKCFGNHLLVTAKLLLNLSRIYEDCGDKEMEEKTAKKAIDAYLYVYEKVEISQAQFQQLCIVIGDLFLKLNDLQKAKKYYFKAKTSENITPVLKRQAEDRLDDIRALEGRKQD